jgi:RNA polymerase sigma factor (sigma-70 family)
VMAEQVSDAILLERFVSHHEEAAFAALIKRHRVRLKGTCSRILRNDHDVEDVLQATFLILARKAGAIPWRESVGSWLCAVAYRLALSARADATRQERREISFAALGLAGRTPRGLEIAGRLPERYHPLDDAALEVERRDLRRLVDDELLQLPEKYRGPVILCDLEGRTHQEAAQVLGWPSGSISRRLDRARAILRRRLIHRGITLSIGLAGIAVAAFIAYHTIHRHDRQNLVVRQMMTQLKPLSDGARGSAGILDRISLNEPTIEPADMIALARRTAEVAALIADHDPGYSREIWRASATTMHDSALLLARATEENDRTALVSAALRLDAACLKCHEIFRQ